MQAGKDKPGANANATRVSAQELAEYRANLDGLMQRCLTSVRRAPVPVQTDPVLEWNAHERGSH